MIQKKSYNNNACSDFQNQGAYRFILMLNPVQDSSCNGVSQKIDLLDNSVEGTGYIVCIFRISPRLLNFRMVVISIAHSRIWLVAANTMLELISTGSIPQISQTFISEFGLHKGNGEKSWLKLFSTFSPINFQFKYEDLQSKDLNPDPIDDPNGNGPDNSN